MSKTCISHLISLGSQILQELLGDSYSYEINICSEKNINLGLNATAVLLTLLKWHTFKKIIFII